ncbi:MAG: RecB family exonuclease [Acidimicrobiia bacterium]
MPTHYLDTLPVVVMLEQLPPGQPIGVSATLFIAYQNCPQQALARLRGIYGPPSRASFRGLLAHRIFARHINSGPIASDDVAQACREETGENLNGVLSDLGLVPSEFRSVVAEVADLYERFQTLPLDGAAEAEKEFDVEVGADVRVRGRIDAVFADDAGTRIVDWKTGKDLGDDVTDQLLFYAWAWKVATGEPPSATEAMSVTTGERLVEDFDADDLGEIESSVAEMVSVLREAMSADTDVSRTGGPHCRWCPLLEDCSEGKAAVELLG